jgi:Icc-related predicted phosphoesterase
MVVRLSWLFVYGAGHIHEGFGATTNGETTFINASTCNYRYDRYNLNPPIVFDVATKRH